MPSTPLHVSHAPPDHSTTTTLCCVRAVLNLGSVYFLEHVWRALLAPISLWLDSRTVYPVPVASTLTSQEVRCVMPVLWEASTTSLERTAASAALQVPSRHYRVPHHVHHVQWGLFATRPVAVSARHVLQVGRLSRVEPQTVLPVDLACTSPLT